MENTRIPLQPGTVISYDGIEAVIIKDNGGPRFIVNCNKSKEVWSWELDDIKCEILSGPRFLVQAEIEYQREDGTWVHSDIEPNGCNFNDIDNKHRKYLHDLLDEWINSSNCTGAFYIKDANYKLY